MKKISRSFFILISLAVLIILITFFLLIPKNNSNQGENTFNKNIAWDEAVTILNSGDVKEVFQSHDLEVKLTLKNGDVLNTKQPKIDDIFDEVKKCEKLCKNIILITE